jgi:DNA replication protein DnaD
MAVTIQKNKAKAKPEPKQDEVIDTSEMSVEDQIAAKLDELGDLYMQLVPAKKAVANLQKQYKPLFEVIEEFVDTDADPDEEVTLQTEKYAAVFGAHANMTKVVAPGKTFKILESIEKGLGQKLMTFSITDLRKYLSEDQFNSVTETSRSKARTVKIAELD